MRFFNNIDIQIFLNYICNDWRIFAHVQRHLKHLGHMYQCLQINLMRPSLDVTTATGHSQRTLI